MIPNNWDNVTLEGFAAFNRSLKEEPANDIESIELMIKQVMYITDCEVEEAELATIDDFKQLKKLINTEKPQRLIKTFKLNGIKYRFKLLSGTRSGGELTAINNVSKRGVIDNLHQIMFLISEPLKFGFKKQFPFIGWKPYTFDNVEVPDRINDFKQMTLKVANPAAVFFSKVRKELQPLLANYLIEVMMEQQREMKELEQDLKSLTD